MAAKSSTRAPDDVKATRRANGKDTRGQSRLREIVSRIGAAAATQAVTSRDLRRANVGETASESPGACA
jgi:hypothetical protein